ALKPDCVVYNPMWPDTDEVVRILEAGVNVVSTAAFINGRGLGADRDRIVDACERGGSSMFGTGISPGFVELVGIAAAGICDRIDKITIDEASDTTLYDSPETERPAGFGRLIDDPELPGMAAKGTAVCGEGVALVADALGVDLDEIVCEAEYAQTTDDVVMESWTIPAGCVAGGAAGPPNVRMKLDYLPPPDFEATTFADFMVLGMIMTAMPAINAIPHVVAAPP